jgi:hypothetical protein
MVMRQGHGLRLHAADETSGTTTRARKGLGDRAMVDHRRNGRAGRERSPSGGWRPGRASQRYSDQRPLDATLDAAVVRLVH